MCQHIPSQSLHGLAFPLTSWGLCFSQHAMNTGRGNLKSRQQLSVLTVLTPNLSGLWMSLLHLCLFGVNEIFSKESFFLLSEVKEGTGGGLDPSRQFRAAG